MGWIISLNSFLTQIGLVTLEKRRWCVFLLLEKSAQSHATFYAYGLRAGSGDNAYSKGDRLVYNTTVLNPGNHYSNVTGEYTCPTTGIYLFVYSIYGYDIKKGKIYINNYNCAILLNDIIHILYSVFVLWLHVMFDILFIYVCLYYICIVLVYVFILYLYCACVRVHTIFLLCLCICLCTILVYRVHIVFVYCVSILVLV